MNKDTRLIFEAFASHQKPASDTTSDDPMSKIEAKRKERKNIGEVRSKSEDAEGHSTEAEIEKLLNYLRQDYSSGKGLDNDALGDVIHEIEDIIRSGNPNLGSEDAEKNHGSAYSEDAETWGVEGKLKEALKEIEGVGYGGDGLDTLAVAKLVVGSPGDWGDSYEPLVQALNHVIKEYYGKGIQDS